MAMGGNAATLEAALLEREGSLARAAGRWSRLAHASAVAFVVVLYANPMYWWPWFESLRLGFLTMAAAGGAVVAARLASGEPLRLGGRAAVPLYLYGAMIPLSMLWTIAPHETAKASVEGAKMFVVFVALQTALDTPRRLRRFLLAAAVASLGPALGTLHVWRTGDALVEGFRSHWRGMYADPNRLAMSLVAVLPFALYGFATSRRRAARVLFAFTAAAQLAAIVLTHSRSGAVATAVALGLFLWRGSIGRARAAVAALAIAVGVGTLAPASFWERQASIAGYREDASVEGRRHAWQVLGNIVEDRPLTGVGAWSFLSAWDRYAPLSAGGHRFVAHNVLLEIVGELGVVAFALFCAWAIAILWQVWRAGRDPLVRGEARAILAALAGYLVCEMVNGYSLSWFLYFLFGCAAAAARLARTGEALRAEAASPRRPAA